MQINMAGFNMGMRITADNFSNNKTNAGFINSPNTGKYDAFGAQCKVTISREGRIKSEQEKQPEEGSVTDVHMERVLMREQERSQAYKSEQSDIQNEISELMKAIQNSYTSGEDKETIQKRQEALNKMNDLKKRQEEENEQRMKDALKGISESSNAREEIDRKNEELLMMLKSFEKQEDEEGETSGKKKNTDTDRKEQDGAGAQIQESAVMLGVSAAKRELETTGTIDELKNDGYSKLSEVNQIMHEINDELDMAAEAAGDESLSEEERRKLASDHTKAAQGMLAGNYGDMAELRRKGLQEIKDARGLEQEHIKGNPLDGVKQAKQAIMNASVDAAFQEEASNVLDRTSQELEDKVQEAIDRRNDGTADSAKKAEEEAKEAEEKKAEEEISEKEAQKAAEEEKNTILI